jgi:hypothetical protein
MWSNNWNDKAQQSLCRPGQALTNSRRLRLPGFLNNRHMQVVSPTHRPPVKVILLVIWDAFIFYYNIFTPYLYECYMSLNLKSDCQERQNVLIIAPESSGLENTAKAKTALRDILKRPRLQCASHILGTSQSDIHLVRTKNCFRRSRTSLGKLPSVNGRNVFTKNRPDIRHIT